MRVGERKRRRQRGARLAKVRVLILLVSFVSRFLVNAMAADMNGTLRFLSDVLKVMKVVSNSCERLHLEGKKPNLAGCAAKQCQLIDCRK